MADDGALARARQAWNWWRSLRFAGLRKRMLTLYLLCVIFAAEMLTIGLFASDLVRRETLAAGVATEASIALAFTVFSVLVLLGIAPVLGVYYGLVRQQRHY